MGEVWPALVTKNRHYQFQDLGFADPHKNGTPQNKTNQGFYTPMAALVDVHPVQRKRGTVRGHKSIFNQIKN